MATEVNDQLKAAGTATNEAVEAASAATEASASIASSLFSRATAEAGKLREKAADAALGYAETGRDQTSNILDNVAKLIGDSAGTVDGKIGEQFGDYARKAAEALTAASTNLKEKDIDELIADARDYVKKSPAIAIGAAAAAGFLVARVLKAGSTEVADKAKKQTNKKA